MIKFLKKTSVSDPVWYESGINQVSGSRRAKKTHKSRKKLNFFKVLVIKPNPDPDPDRYSA
jgi:hypothetical protein